MRPVRRLAPLSLAALCALLATLGALPATSAASTCITSTGGRVSDGLTSSSLSSGCSQAIMSVSPNPAAPGATVTLDGSQSVSDPTDPIATYDFDFGDGTTAAQTTAPTASVTHPYARGAYTTTLTILDGTSTPLDATSVRLLVDDPPAAALSAPVGTLKPGVAYGFDASGSSTPDAGLGGSIVRYDWDWGDGTTTPNGGARPQHAFAADGSPSVTVTVYDDLGASATATATVNVFDILPLVTLVATPATVEVGQPVRLDASGTSDPDGTIAEYRWDLDGNGSFETSTGTTPTVTVAAGYPNPGAITLSVKAIDDSGGFSVKGVTITVTASPDSGGSGGSDGGSSGSGSGSGGGSSGGTGSGSGGTGTSTGGGGSSDASGPQAFAVSLSGDAIQRLKIALRRGVGLRAMANRAARGKLTMTVSPADARRLHLRGRRGRPVAIGVLRLALRAGRTAKPSIKLTRAAARTLRRAKPRMLRVTIRGSLAAGKASAAVVRVVLLRT